MAPSSLVSFVVIDAKAQVRMDKLSIEKLCRFDRAA